MLNADGGKEPVENIHYLQRRIPVPTTSQVMSVQMFNLQMQVAARAKKEEPNVIAHET